MVSAGRDGDAKARYPLKRLRREKIVSGSRRHHLRPQMRREENSLVQLKVSIALATLACASVGCAQNGVPEPVLSSLPTPVPDDKAQNVISGPTPGPDDKSAIASDCSGLLQGWNNCLLTASNTCGSRGYTIVDRSDQNPAQPNEAVFARSMHIRCNS